jgi:hypothetical protein
MRSRFALAILVSAVELALLVPLLDRALAAHLARKHIPDLPLAQLTNRRAVLVGSAQGFNPGNIYWAVVYDCRNGDVEVTGELPECLYWSAVPYGWDTLPLRSFVFDETAQTDKSRRYTLRLTRNATGAANEIDVAASPTGFLVIRCSYPDDSATVTKNPPQVRALP